MIDTLLTLSRILSALGRNFNREQRFDCVLPFQLILGGTVILILYMATLDNLSFTESGTRWAAVSWTSSVQQPRRR